MSLSFLKKLKCYVLEEVKNLKEYIADTSGPIALSMNQFDKRVSSQLYNLFYSGNLTLLQINN